MAMFAAPAAIAGLRALGVDERSAQLGLAAAKKALPVAKGLFRAAFGRKKKKNVRELLGKAPAELQKMVPGLLNAKSQHALFDQLSRINENPSGVKAAMLKKAAQAMLEHRAGR